MPSLEWIFKTATGKTPMEWSETGDLDWYSAYADGSDTGTDLNTGGVLILHADSLDRERFKTRLEEIPQEHAFRDYSADGALCQLEEEIIESLTCNSELDSIRPEEIAALTSAPILGIREGTEVVAAWGYMDYAVRSFAQDLIETGKAVFRS